MGRMLLKAFRMGKVAKICSPHLSLPQEYKLKSPAKHISLNLAQKALNIALYMNTHIVDTPLAIYKNKSKQTYNKHAHAAYTRLVYVA